MTFVDVNSKLSFRKRHVDYWRHMYTVCLVMMQTHHYMSKRSNYHNSIFACQLLVVLMELLNDKVSCISNTV